MTDYACYVYPDVEYYQQVLTGSLDDGLDRWDGYALALMDEWLPVIVDLGARTPPAWNTVSHDAYVYPEWSSNLFGHILVIPSRLDLGNILTNQNRTIEIANLFLTAQDWESLSTDVDGLVFVNAPAGLEASPITPYSIPSFGSYLLQVSISATGAATIEGMIFLGFESEDVDVPVTGTRVVVFPFQPRPGIVETLEWKTDVMEAYDGTEQRVGLRLAPRQSVRYEIILDTRTDRVMRGLMFDWLARVFALPMWWETRFTTSPTLPGTLVINAPTAYADFRIGGLVMLHASDAAYEVLEIESFDAVSITVASEVVGTYAADTKVMPAVTVFSKTVPSAPRQPADFVEYRVEFTTISNRYLGDASIWPTYLTKVLLSDCNLLEAGDDDSYQRSVIVLDNETGQVFQTSRTDRSRHFTKKVWDAPSQQRLWEVRTLLHHLNGSRLSFWLPTFRDDLTIADVIGPGSSTLRVVQEGYTTFYKSRRPFGDIRLTLTDGRTITRQVIDSEIDGDQEVLTVSSAFDAAPIFVVDVVRIEFVMLVRISDDRAQINHRTLDDAGVEINLITIKE